MKGRGRFVAVACVVAILTIVAIFHSKEATGVRPGVLATGLTKTSSAAITAPAESPSFQAKYPGNISVPIASRAASPTLPATNPVLNLPPHTVLENIRSAIRLYGTTFGGNPVGDNAEITACLAGNNAKQVNFIGNDSGIRLNEKGEMVDFWGTAFFFHQLSGSETEIRSAGPDKKMWTADDLTVK